MKWEEIARVGRGEEWETGAGNVNRTYLKRVNFLQMSNYQLFRKTQLAFNHVLIPLKSELNFNKSLIVNDLTKCNSLQTFVFWRPGKQHLCRGNAGEDGPVDESDFTGIFSTPQPAGLFWNN